jgi:glycosyltransferase family protein
LQALAALRLPGAPLRVADERTTLRTLRDRRASLARYGDGELEIMIGRGINFQEYDAELARRLRTILRAATAQFLVGIPNFPALQIRTGSRKRSWERYQCMYSHLVRRGAEYHSAFVSRPASVVGLESAEYFRDFEPLWAGRDVVLVHNSAATAGHPLFRPARSVRHIPCAAQHAFREYPALLERATACLATPEVLYLIAAGPTAGVLAWDLAQRGAQALDIGHLTNAYDEFLGRR